MKDLIDYWRNEWKQVTDLSPLDPAGTGSGDLLDYWRNEWRQATDMSAFGVDNSANSVTHSTGKGWYVNNKTGDYQWHKDSDRHEGYTKVGTYKVEYNENTNAIDIFYQEQTDAMESIFMQQRSDGGYVEDWAAKFAMIAAESGGKNMKNIDPLYDALIISASMDNRLYVEMYFDGSPHPFSTKESRAKFGENTYQSIFLPNQYQAVKATSYLDFAKGHAGRFGSDKRLANIGLATVYNAMSNPIIKLTRDYDMSQAINILAYGHKPSSPSLFKDFSIPFDKTLAPNMNSVKGSYYWKP